MDRTDKFINNRPPKTLFLTLIVSLAFLAVLSRIVSAKCADIIVSQNIRSMLSAVGGGKFTASPAPESVVNGENLLGRYSIDSNMTPRLMYNWKSVQRLIFLLMFSVSSAVSLIWFCLSMHEIFSIYDKLENLRKDCINAAERPDGRIALQGETFGCVRRISESAALLAGRMNFIGSCLESERTFLKEFLTDFSHQIKNSLAVVRLNVDMLGSAVSFSEEQRRNLDDEIQLNLDSMEKLVVEAIKLAKLNTGAVEYNMKVQKLSDTCNLALKRISPLLRKKNISLRLNLPDEINLLHDKGWLSEAVGNIIKNSADHSDCTEITAEIEENPSVIKICLSDNGRGIPQENIPKLFERFGKKSGDMTMNNAGVGMSIAKKIVQNHGGEIMVYSEKEKGTSFELVFLK